MEKKKVKIGRPKSVKNLERLCLSISKKDKESLKILADRSESGSVSNYIRNLIKEKQEATIF